MHHDIFPSNQLRMCFNMAQEYSLFLHHHTTAVECHNGTLRSYCTMLTTGWLLLQICRSAETHFHTASGGVFVLLRVQFMIRKLSQSHSILLSVGINIRDYGRVASWLVKPVSSSSSSSRHSDLNQQRRRWWWLQSSSRFYGIKSGDSCRPINGLWVDGRACTMNQD